MSIPLDTHPAFKHVKSSVTQANHKGIRGSVFALSMLHFAAKQMFKLDDEAANLMARSLFAYAATLMFRSEAKSKGETVDATSSPERELAFREVEDPPFLSGHFTVLE